jgi:putative protease
MSDGVVVRPEILSPAGEWSALEAAIRGGCDAVYFGVGDLNMRSSARNFKAEELGDIEARCRQSDVLAYITLNTIVYEKELGLLDGYLDMAREAGVDAVIASDLAVIDSARSRGLDVHISTQMSVSNSRSLGVLFEKFNVRRFVLSRECTLEDIVLIRRRLHKLLGDDADEIEFETFAHGAMCVAVSGRCFMSQDQYGKSANRGECLQPCRREYRVTNVEEEQEFDLGDHYVMSPKDLCTLPFVEKLIDAGIASLKIEGRNRSPEYVGAVTRAYREVVDTYIMQRRESGFAEKFATLKQEKMTEIERVFHRGYSSGFFMGHPMDAWTKSGGSQATTRKYYVGLVTNYFARPGVAEVKVVDNSIALGDSVLFTGATTGAVEQELQSMQVAHESVDRVDKGTLVAVKVDEPVRRNDKMYVIVATA